MLDIKTTNGPTLAAGAVDFTFGEMEKVIDAVVFFESPDISDYAFGTSTVKSGNTVTVTVKKIDVTQASVVAWANAVTTDLANLDVAVMAKGE